MPDTLGSLIVSRGAPDVVGNTERLAGSYAFIPGFTPQSITSESDIPRDGKVEFSLDPGSTSDLRQSSLRALEEYAQTRLATNAFYPGNLPTDPSGHRSNEALKNVVEDDDARPYLPSSDTLFYNQPGTKSTIGQIQELAHTVETSNENPAPVFLFDSEKLKSHKGPADGFNNSRTSFGTKQSSKDPTFDPRVNPENLSQYADFLLNQNRFDPGPSSPFLLPAGDGEVGENRMQKGLFSFQSGKLGKFDPLAEGVTTNDMRAAAIEALLRAQTIDGDFGGGLAGKIAKDFAGVGGSGFFDIDLLYLVPQPSQLGFGTAAIESMRIRSQSSISKFGLAEGADDLLALKSFQTWMGFGFAEDDYLKAKGDRIRFGTSFGTLNSPAEKFGNPSPFGMIFPIIFSFVGFAIMSIIIGGLMSLAIEGDASRVAKNVEEPSTLNFGTSYPKSVDTIGQKLLQMYNLPRVVAGDFMSVIRGLCVFYGINISPLDPTQTPGFDAFINLLLSPGYYTTISKQVLRDFTQISDATLEFEKLSNTPSVFLTVSMIFGFLDALFSSLFVRFFFVMSHYGALWEMSKNPGTFAHMGNIVPLTRQNLEKRMSPELRGRISRFQTGPTSAVGSTSLMLYNAYLIATPDSQGPIPFRAKSGMNDMAGVQVSTAKVLSPEQVQRIESLIDREYMPFSIQDLRTNEVISLPAFINQVTEDFNVEYSQSQGFGRTDPVYSYGKAVRMITLNFTLIAQNKEDHDYMWYIINKLVAMLYPQRGPGQHRKLDGQNFIQPFSQTPTASPVIRIRLGELLHTNASNTAFAKIFGGQGIINAKAEIPSTTKGVPDNIALQQAQSIVNQKAKTMWSLVSAPGATDDSIDQAVELVKTKEVKLNGPALSVDPDTDPDKPGYLETTLQYERIGKVSGLIKVKAKAKAQSNDTDKDKAEGDKAKFNYYWKVDIEYEDEIDAYAHGEQPARHHYNKGQPPIPLPFGPKAKPVTYLVLSSPTTADLLVPTTLSQAQTLIQDGDITEDMVTQDLTKQLEVEKDTGGVTTATEAEIENMKKAYAAVKEAPPTVMAESGVYPEFLSPSKNPVRKAFQTSGGAGLAGVIMNMSLDYAQYAWGTTHEFPKHTEMRAPKGVNINMSFAPIHDMPLGLNHNGEMFAPSHPVGHLGPTKNVGFGSKKDAELLADEARRDSIKNQKILAVPLPLKEDKDPAKPSFF